MVVPDPLPPKRLRRRLGLALTTSATGAAARPDRTRRGAIDNREDHTL
jgi:hypothetical protein